MTRISIMRTITQTNTPSLSGLLGLALAFTSVGHALAQVQTDQQTKPAEQIQAAQPAPQPADTSQPTIQPAPDQAQTGPSLVETKAAPASTTPLPAAPAVKDKKGKQEYTGPNTVVELPPTPMLDAEGKQQQDPDGKLMFNPPIRQQRDKKGHPLFDAQNKPVMQTKNELGYDENGKKLHAPKEKPPKTVSVSISRGTLTVDGMTGKAALNYEIKDLKYVYIYVPGVGTTIISNDPFPGAVEQKRAFDDKTLTVTVGDHVLQLASDNRLLGKTAESAYVLVDRSFTVPTKFPVVGYGPIRVAPYAWPGSKENAVLTGSIEAPPLPADLRPTLLLQPCPAGQMRTAGPAVLPGQNVAPRPCVPIDSVQTTATYARQTALSMGNTQASK
ncbi:hypothetical protein [Tunturibacter empetritectus]|uniref:Organic solvent tolerance-like N-terminal domain-containing protein n=1 Tax=Tunturiibacter lichenicola TaxID=2051959 RepID=A0A7W8J8N2_9BACT|nr:hypothetical protein [Edaphobacter lichenicola]MBB5344620.1 hypothetical protein [Edaphobacter lichenicola]